MENKIMIGEKIYKLRKQNMLSQSQLGKLVGVSNKAVSKWENLEANPEISILPKLAEALNVSTDELLGNENISKKTADNYFFGIKGEINKTNTSFEFISNKRTKKGIPFLHINLGFKNGKMLKANGIISVGLIAKGLISLGLISYGLVSLGVLALGLLSIGAISLGLLVALGAVSVGIGVSVGGVAVGTLAVGGIAIGIFSVGGLSVGIWSHTGVAEKAVGIYKFFH